MALAVLVLAESMACASPLPVAPGAGVRIQPFGIYGHTRRHVVAVTAPASFNARIRVPPNARLLSAVSVPDRVWTTSIGATAAPITFRVRFQDAHEDVLLYERIIDIANVAADRRWFDFGRDLGGLAGREGTLYFEATPALAGAAAATLALWAPPEVVTCDGTQPSLLLVTIDALRGDRLSAAGYPRMTTPHLDHFAADATRFAAAFAAAPKTIPSIPQILTGSYFFRYRAMPGLGALLGPGRLELSRAVVNNPFISNWLEGEDPGFQVVAAGDDLDAHAITTEALRYLSAAGRCPTALYLHYLDTHTPYHAPSRYARMFIDSRAATTVGLTFDDVSGAWQNRYARADRRRIADLYDGSIAWTDRQLGRLFRGLARRHLTDRTVVVVTADHGEEFWEHGNFFHGQSLYDELLHVPLIVRVPTGGHGRVVTEPVSTIDVLPTLIEAAGLSPVPFEGKSLLPLAMGAERSSAETPARPIFATVSNAEPRTPPRHAVRTRTMKLIRNVSDGLVEVYDLVADPREQRNLGPDAPGAAQLAADLDAIRHRLVGRGYRLRLRSRRDRPVAYVVRLAGEQPVPIVDPDRLTLEPSDRLQAGPRSTALSVSGTLDPGDEDEVRMDIVGSNAKLRITVTLDGAPAPAGTLRLGAGAKPLEGLVDLADPSIAGEPTNLADDVPILAYLWRASQPGASTAVPPTPDAATRARLRALGYSD